MRDTFKQWMSCLNQWVIRHENLKKYHVVRQLGSGAFAKVYYVTRQAQPSSKLEQYAIKVVVKEDLEKKPKFERLQMISEIRTQRSLRLCSNVIKLMKIYESDKYLNLLMEY
jgi:serine/threonine protein kinase